jgi:hypothetical protein
MFWPDDVTRNREGNACFNDATTTGYRNYRGIRTGGWTTHNGRAGQASAAQQQICDSNDSNLCINNTLGEASLTKPIQMWTAGKTNEDFTAQPINRCGNSSDTSTIDCPFGGKAYNWNAMFAGSTIVQLRYESTNKCVAASSSATGSCKSNRRCASVRAADYRLGVLTRLRCDPGRWSPCGIIDLSVNGNWIVLR